MRPGPIAFLFSLSLVVLGACGQAAEEVVIRDRDGRIAALIQRKGELKDGPVTLFWPGGAVRMEGLYRNDRRTGWWTGKYPDGHWRSQTHYLNGRKEGVRLYWDSLGRVERSERFVNGLHNGPFVRRFADGRIAQRSTYVNDKLEGPHIQWYDDRGGSVVKGAYENDLAQGLWTEYDTTGRMIWQGYFNAGVLERLIHGKRRKH